MRTFEKHSKANKMKSMVNTNRNLHLTLRCRLGPFEKTPLETKGDERKIGYFVSHFIQPLVKIETFADLKMPKTTTWRP